jgi:hypothetical protein
MYASYNPRLPLRAFDDDVCPCVCCANFGRDAEVARMADAARALARRVR